MTTTTWQNIIVFNLIMLIIQKRTILSNTSRQFYSNYLSNAESVPAKFWCIFIKKNTNKFSPSPLKMVIHKQEVTFLFQEVLPLGNHIIIV